MAVKTIEALAEEEVRTAECRLAHRVGLPLDVAIIGAVAADQGALKTGQRLGEIGHGNGRIIARKGGSKHVGVALICRESFQ